MKVRIINRSKNELPDHATVHSAGIDLKADLKKELVIRSLERVLVPTGLFIEVPEGYEAQIRPRSGLAIKSGISVLNTPGTIDSDYRGEIMVILINLSKEDFTIKNGDRICQMIISKYERIQFEEVEELSETIRGKGGFGHTGNK